MHLFFSFFACATPIVCLFVCLFFTRGRGNVLSLVHSFDVLRDICNKFDALRLTPACLKTVGSLAHYLVVILCMYCLVYMSIDVPSFDDLAARFAALNDMK